MTGKAGSFLLVLCSLLGLSVKLQSKATLVGHSNVFNLRTFTEEENSESNGFRLIEETNIFSLNTKEKSPGEEIPSGLSLVFETNLFSLNTKKNNSKVSDSSQLTLVFETNPFSVNTKEKNSKGSDSSHLTMVIETNIFSLNTRQKNPWEEINSGLSIVFETNSFNLNTKPYQDPHESEQSRSLFKLVIETEIFGLNTHPKDSGPPPNGTKRIGGLLTIVHETEIFPVSTHPIFRPLIDTLRPKELENGNILLVAEILSDGGLPIAEQGFEISRHINFLEMLSYPASYNPDNQEFSYLLTPSNRKEYQYFRAFARNAVGLKYGVTLKLTGLTPSYSSWEDAERMDNGWINSSWFGAFLPFNNGWMYHSNLGWVFSRSDTSQGIWLWFGPENWFWTQRLVYPYFFKWENKEWMYHIYSDNTENSFISHQTKEFVSISKVE